MDPLTITTACFTLVTTISKASCSLVDFTRAFRDAKGDLNTIQSDLHSFRKTIETLVQACTECDEILLPLNLRQQIYDTIGACDNIVHDIEACVTKHSQSMFGNRGYWTICGGRNDMVEFHTRLEVHKSLLELQIHQVNFHITRDIKKDTAQIPAILEKIKDLEARLSKNVSQSGQDSYNPVLKKWLEDTGHSVGYSSSAEQTLRDYESGTSDCETIISRRHTGRQTRSNRSQHIISVPFMQDAWNYSPISWTTNHYSTLISTPNLYDPPAPFSANTFTNSTSSLFLKLTPWIDTSLDNPSLTFETIYRCLRYDSPVLRLGRRDDKRAPAPNFISFETRAVSRVHCEVYRHDNGKWSIRDLGSLSGTFLNSQRLSDPYEMSKWFFLGEQDVIELGKNIEGFVHRRVKMMISCVGWGCW